MSHDSILYNRDLLKGPRLENKKHRKINPKFLDLYLRHDIYSVVSLSLSLSDTHTHTKYIYVHMHGFLISNRLHIDIPHIRIREIDVPHRRIRILTFYH